MCRIMLCDVETWTNQIESSSSFWPCEWKSLSHCFRFVNSYKQCKRTFLSSFIFLFVFFQYFSLFNHFNRASGGCNVDEKRQLVFSFFSFFSSSTFFSFSSAINANEEIRLEISIFIYVHRLFCSVQRFSSPQ